MEKTCTSEALDEIERDIPENVKHIRKILQEQQNIRISNQCDQFISRCLRQKDGDIDKAVQLLLAYQDTISDLRRWDVSFLPSSFKEVYASGLLVPLEHPDSNGCHLSIFRIGQWDPQQFSFEHVAAFLWMLNQYNQSERIYMQRNGFVTVCDLTGFSLRHTLALKPRKVLTLLKWAKNGVGGRFKGLHYINLPKPAQILLKAVRPFMSKKVQERMIVHDNLESLLQVMDRSLLPTIVGGDLDAEECIDSSLINDFFNGDQYVLDMLDVGLPSK